ARAGIQHDYRPVSRQLPEGVASIYQSGSGGSLAPAPALDQPPERASVEAIRPTGKDRAGPGHYGADGDIQPERCLPARAMLEHLLNHRASHGANAHLDQRNPLHRMLPPLTDAGRLVVRPVTETSPFQQ